MSEILSLEFMMCFLIAGFLGALPIAIFVGLWDLGVWFKKNQRRQNNE